MSNGLVKIKLAKAWNKHKKGSTVEVDPIRAEWLIDNDYRDLDRPKDKTGTKA